MGHPERLQQMVSPSSNVEEVPENFYSLSSTRMNGSDDQDKNSPANLDLEAKDLTAFPLSTVTDYGPQLVHLNLNFNSITKLPAGLSKLLPQLETFLANGNDLSVLSDEFGDFVHLQELSLCENNLTSIPESLCKLTKLRVLKLNANSLRKLHTEIGQNTHLEILSVDENNLRRLPATLGLLRNLQVLEANSNKLEALPSTLNFMENLRTVDLSSNRLSSIPESFGELANLTHVDLSENKLRCLSEKFCSASKLEHLYLDFNLFSSCPEWFCEMESIIEISVKDNNLAGAALPEGFGIKSVHLKYLDLRGNSIESLPQSFGHLMSLETLLLGTPREELERKLTFQNGNWLSKLPPSFTQLTSLTKVFMEENQLRNLPQDIGNLVHVEDLFLGANMLWELPASFTKLRSLKRCQLSKNCLQSLPDDFGDLELLTELYLDTNRLKTLPASMKNLTNLEILDLTENKLKQVPTGIISAMTKLKALNLFFNKFDVPETEIPNIVRRSHYAERNPELKGNWRGRNNGPEAVVERFVVLPSVPIGQRKADRKHDRDDEHDTSNDDDIVDPESSEEDWDKEINNSYTSSASTDRLPQVNDDEDENWDDEVSPKEQPSRLGFEKGQFDLDDEEPEKPQVFLPPPVRFDRYGNASQLIDLDIQRHRSCPYIYHAPRISRWLYDPGTFTPGQFDSDNSDEENCDLSSGKEESALHRDSCISVCGNELQNTTGNSGVAQVGDSVDDDDHIGEKNYLPNFANKPESPSVTTNTEHCNERGDEELIKKDENIISSAFSKETGKDLCIHEKGDDVLIHSDVNVSKKVYAS